MTDPRSSFRMSTELFHLLPPFRQTITRYRIIKPCFFGNIANSAMPFAKAFLNPIRQEWTLCSGYIFKKLSFIFNKTNSAFLCIRKCSIPIHIPFNLQFNYYIGYSVCLIAMERRKNAGQVFFNLRLLAFYSNVIIILQSKHDGPIVDATIPVIMTIESYIHCTIFNYSCGYFIILFDESPVCHRG